jgi:predicted neutral ceramidase superfamily lipid hydrolase
MNKIVLNFGLLVFFLSLVFFSQQGLPIEDVFLKAFLIFVSVTLILGVITILFVKAINKTALEKGKNLNDNLHGES